MKPIPSITSVQIERQLENLRHTLELMPSAYLCLRLELMQHDADERAIAYSASYLVTSTPSSQSTSRQRD